VWTRSIATSCQTSRSEAALAAANRPNTLARDARHPAGETAEFESEIFARMLPEIMGSEYKASNQQPAQMTTATSGLPTVAAAMRVAISRALRQLEEVGRDGLIWRTRSP